MLSLRECLSEAGGNSFFKSKTEKTIQRVSKEHLKFELSPETGKHNLLWMIGEIGEVIDIVKKYGDIEPTNDVELRNHLVEEMADVLMHYNDEIGRAHV